MAPKRARQGTRLLDPVFGRRSALPVFGSFARSYPTYADQIKHFKRPFVKVVTTFVEDDPEPAREEGPARKQMKETDQARFAQCARCEETYDLLSAGDSMTCKRHSDMYLSS